MQILNRLSDHMTGKLSELSIKYAPEHEPQREAGFHARQDPFPAPEIKNHSRETLVPLKTLSSQCLRMQELITDQGFLSF